MSVLLEGVIFTVIFPCAFRVEEHRSKEAELPMKMGRGEGRAVLNVFTGEGMF